MRPDSSNSAYAVAGRDIPRHDFLLVVAPMTSLGDQRVFRRKNGSVARTACNWAHNSGRLGRRGMEITIAASTIAIAMAALRDETVR
jgi:hypothetical protein